MADLRIFWTIFILFGCTFDIGYGITFSPPHSKYCVSETIRGYSWNQTDSGITASQPCKSPYNRGQIFRTCKDGVWSEPEYSTCRTVVVADKDTIYVIQYVCCGTTMLCVLLTLFILVFAWRNAGSGTTILEISFGLAIIASNIAFLAGVNNTSNELMCKITAVCLHYLPTVTVFHLFSIIFHLSTLRFQTSQYSYCCLLFSAWVYPALIVGLYGYLTTLEEYGNSKNCWMLFSTRLFWVYYGTLMSICGLIFLSVFFVIYRMKLPGRGPKLGSLIGIVPMCIVFITTVMTWVTGVISVNEYNDGLYITQIIFGTFDFIQGLVYLIVFGVLGSRARKEKVVAGEEYMYGPQAFRKSETRISKMSPPTIYTYTGYHDDHVRDWSYNHHLQNKQRPRVMDFYSTDEEVQNRYVEERFKEYLRDKRTSERATSEDSRGDISSFQVNDTPERQGNTVVVVHKEVVIAPDADNIPDQSQSVHTIQQQVVNVGNNFPNTPAIDERFRYSAFNVGHDDSGEIFQDHREPEEDETSKVVANRSQAFSQSPPSHGHLLGPNHATQSSSPVTQRPRNLIDPPAPSKISVTEIETFTIDVPEEKVAKSQSNEFILQEEGEVVMEYRNDHYPTTENIDHEDATHDHPQTSEVPFQYHQTPATTYPDDTESHTGSMIGYQEEEGNTLLHITNGIVMDTGYDQDDEDSDHNSGTFSQQPAPLTTSTEDQPVNSYPSSTSVQQEPESTDISSLRTKLKTRKYSNDDAKPQPQLDLSSSFLSRLRKKLRPVSKTPIHKDFPQVRVVPQEPEPDYEGDALNNDPTSIFAIDNQSEDVRDEVSRRRQMETSDENLLPPPPNSPETADRPPTPPPPFVPPPRPPTPPTSFDPSYYNPPQSLASPPLAPPPPPIPQSSPQGKHVSFTNRDVEISS